MNVLQIARKALFEVDAIRSGGTLSGLWTAEEYTDAVNTAVDSAYRVFRSAGADLVTKRMTSTDSAVDFISESYAPSSLRTVIDTSTYTLPPDFVHVVNILPTTSGFDGVSFRPANTTQKYFMEQQVIPVADLSAVGSGGSQIFFYTIIGARTLLIAPAPKDAFDVRLTYQFRPHRLLYEQAGTVAVTNGNAPVVGTSTVWVTNGIRTPADLVVGTGTGIAAVNVNTHYPAVTTLTSDTALTLTRTYQGATNLTAAYALAMVPQLPEEYHRWLAQRTASELLRKINLELAEKAGIKLEQQLLAEILPEIVTRQVQESIPVEPFEVPE